MCRAPGGASAGQVVPPATEIIFIDDGSRDDTLHMLKDIAKKDKKVKVISFSRNFGHQEAVRLADSPLAYSTKPSEDLPALYGPGRSPLDRLRDGTARIVRKPVAATGGEASRPDAAVAVSRGSVAVSVKCS